MEACFVEPTWTEVTAGNWGDRWDIAYGSGSINEDRMQRLYMTQPYYAVPNGYFVAKRSRVPARSPTSTASGSARAPTARTSSTSRAQLEIPSVDITLERQGPAGRDVSRPRRPGLEGGGEGQDRRVPRRRAGRAARGSRRGEALRRAPRATRSRTTRRASSTRAPDSARRDSWTRSNEIIGGLQADGTLKRLSKKFFGARLRARRRRTYDIDAMKQDVERPVRRDRGAGAAGRRTQPDGAAGADVPGAVAADGRHRRHRFLPAGTGTRSETTGLRPA